MLQCIIGMVDKTKRAVSVLQTRCNQDREELLAWARKTAEETEAEVKRRAGMYLISELRFDFTFNVTTHSSGSNLD